MSEPFEFNPPIYRGNSWSCIWYLKEPDPDNEGELRPIDLTGFTSEFVIWNPQTNANIVRLTNAVIDTDAGSVKFEMTDEQTGAINVLRAPCEMRIFDADGRASVMTAGVVPFSGRYRG